MTTLLDAGQVADIHDSIIESEAGFNAHYETDRLEAVIGRIQHLLFYSEKEFSIVDVAALYCVAIARGHAFPDGNKRTAFLSALTIMQINSLFSEEIRHFLVEFHESESYSYPTELMVLVAEGVIDEEQLANVFYAFIGDGGVIKGMATALSVTTD